VLAEHREGRGVLSPCLVIEAKKIEVGIDLFELFNRFW
jgi:hypothetical protein